MTDDGTPSAALDAHALRTIFLQARTVSAFADRPVPRALLERAVELALLGPTSANSLPLRIVFVETPEAKERLRPALSAGNLEKTMLAPATAIVAADLHFHDALPTTNPERAERLRDMFVAMEPAARRAAAWDNALLQMGYLIVAVRAVGLDAGPMGGFDRSIVDAAFFPDGRFVTQYLINLGYRGGPRLRPRLPRLRVDDVARFA